MILVIANIGIERIMPGTPHIQNQNTSEMMTRTELSVNRLAKSIGVSLKRGSISTRRCTKISPDTRRKKQTAPW